MTARRAARGAAQDARPDAAARARPTSARRTIVALLGDDWGYVTGQTVNIDGGFQMY